MIAITQEEINYVKWCIENDIHKFYIWSKWLHVRLEVLKEDKYECQDCKKNGVYTKATTVHHVNYVKKYPNMALEKFYVYEGKKRKNLISLCHDCHEKRHGYRKNNYKKPLTQERW